MTAGGPASERPTSRAEVLPVGGEVRLQEAEAHRRRIQAWMGLILTGAVLIALLGLLAAAAALVFIGRTEDGGKLLQNAQPYVLPTLGAAVGYVFGNAQASSQSGDTLPAPD